MFNNDQAATDDDGVVVIYSTRIHKTEKGPGFFGKIWGAIKEYNIIKV